MWDLFLFIGNLSIPKWKYVTLFWASLLVTNTNTTKNTIKNTHLLCLNVSPEQTLKTHILSLVCIMSTCSHSNLRSYNNSRHDDVENTTHVPLRSERSIQICYNVMVLGASTNVFPQTKHWSKHTHANKR